MLSLPYVRFLEVARGGWLKQMRRIVSIAFKSGRPERCLNKTDRALGRDAATRSAKLWSDRIATEKPNSLWTGAALVVVPAARSSSHAAPAACCGSGHGRRLGSPLCRAARRFFRSRLFERLRIDWNNRRALVGVTYLLSAGPDLRLSWPAWMRLIELKLGRSAGGGLCGKERPPSVQLNPSARHRHETSTSHGDALKS